MSTLILQTASRFIIPLMVVFSLFVLFRGHNEPGGGFIGGLLIAGAFALHMLTYGSEKTRKTMIVDPRFFIGLGLICAIGSGVISMLAGDPFMTGQWPDLAIPSIGKLSSVLLFDTGIFLIVLGATTTILLALAEEQL